MQQSKVDNLTTFLIADIDQFSQALLRNEEIGERRFNFFLTLVTAVSGGLVALHTAEIQFRGDTLEYIRSGAFAVLFFFGFLTYLRMLQRNRVTDEFKDTLKYIRRQLLDVNGVNIHYEVPLRPEPTKRDLVRRVTGGLAQMVGAMDAALLGLFLFFMFYSLIWAVTISLIVLIAFVAFAIPREGQSLVKALRQGAPRENVTA